MDTSSTPSDPNMPNIIIQPAVPVIGRAFRHRVNVAVTSKGAYSWECTVEGDAFTAEELLAESDRLVAELKRRYSEAGQPPPAGRGPQGTVTIWESEPRT